MTPLTDLKNTRRRLRAAAAAAAQALRRAQGSEAEALAKVREQECALDLTRDRTSYDAVAARLESARVDHLLAGKALKDAAAAANYADMDLGGAEAAVRAEVDRLLRKEDVTDAHEIEMALNRIQQLGIALLHRTVANELNGHLAPSEVTTVLMRLDSPLIDRRNIAINLTLFGDTTAAREREQRRAALTADEETPEHAAA
jgi:hypothetical protein